MIKKLMAGVLLATLALTTIAPAAVSAKGTSGNIVETAISVNDKTGLFDTLLAAAVCTPGIVDALANTEDITLFAPTDGAFRKIGLNKHNVCTTLDDAARAAVLTYHVVPDEVTYREALKLATRKGTEVTMLSGKTTHLIQRGWFRLFIDGKSSDPSRVVLPNVFASNGVIHVINNVLLP